MLLAGRGSSTNAVYHALQREFGALTVIQEPHLSWRFLVRRRLRRLGYRQVVGQILFSVLLVPLLRRSSEKRLESIIEREKMDMSPIAQPMVHVESVNADEVRTLLRDLDPAVVVVNGTRIIKNEVINCVSAPFINVHAGITPQYRGVHGGYWALVDGRPDLVGTTVHLIDEGVDTGPILSQTTFAVEADDSFVTYPYLHVAAGIPLLITAIRDILDGKELEPRPSIGGEMPSRLRSHPTIWGYISCRVRRSVA